MGSPENLIAYCGLYCGDCFIRRGNIADLACKLKKELDRTAPAGFFQGLSLILEEFASLRNYQHCLEILEVLDKLRCPKACKAGGGTASCKIRVCCIGKQIKGCWECDSYENCETLNYLHPVNGDACQKNITKIKNEGIDAFLSGTKYWFG